MDDPCFANNVDADGDESSLASVRERVGKRKHGANASSNVSMSQASSDATLPYEAPAGASVSRDRITEEADKQLALFLELRGIATAAVREAGMEYYFSAYGRGTEAERAGIIPQIDQGLRECSMLKLVQFFRYFLCSDDFDALASKLYGWIQDARTNSNDESPIINGRPGRAEEQLYYLDSDKIQLHQTFCSFLDVVARHSCAPFERRLRADLLEQLIMPAEAEQVAGVVYDALLLTEVNAWNQKLHETGLEAYWLPS